MTMRRGGGNEGNGRNFFTASLSTVVSHGSNFQCPRSGEGSKLMSWLELTIQDQSNDDWSISPFNCRRCREGKREDSSASAAALATLPPFQGRRVKAECIHTYTAVAMCVSVVITNSRADPTRWMEVIFGKYSEKHLSDLADFNEAANSGTTGWSLFSLVCLCPSAERERESLKNASSFSLRCEVENDRVNTNDSIPTVGHWGLTDDVFFRRRCKKRKIHLLYHSDLPQ